MMPLIQGPNPSSMGTLAIVIVVGGGSALIAMATLLGWTTLEVICLIEQYSEP